MATPRFAVQYSCQAVALTFVLTSLVNCLRIAFTRTDPDFGEQKAQSCENACFRQFRIGLDFVWALVFKGKTPCGVCGAPIREGEYCVAFPAFLPGTRRLWKYSDGVFHSKCFANEPNSNEVQSLPRVPLNLGKVS